MVSETVSESNHGREQVVSLYLDTTAEVPPEELSAGFIHTGPSANLFQNDVSIFDYLFLMALYWTPDQCSPIWYRMKKEKLSSFGTYHPCTRRRMDDM